MYVCAFPGRVKLIMYQRLHNWRYIPILPIRPQHILHTLTN